MPIIDGLSSSLEDYLETIYLLNTDNQGARLKDIATEMKVKVPSAHIAIRALSEKEALIYQPYSKIYLTTKGIRFAKKILRRHEQLAFFLSDILLLSQEVASNDACEIEHVIKQETASQLDKFLNYIEELKKENINIQQGFKDFLNKQSN